MQQQETEIHRMAKAFVEHLNGGHESDAPLWEKYMSPDIVSVEGDGMTFTGLEALKGKHEHWASSVTMHWAKAEASFVGKDRFAITMSMECEAKDGSWPRSEITEIGVYDVKDGKVVREEFLSGEMRPVG
jgi:hypothetical protein